MSEFVTDEEEQAFIRAYSEGYEAGRAQHMADVRKARADVIQEILDRIDDGMCEVCSYGNSDHSCMKWCDRNNEEGVDYELEALIEWLKELKKK